MVRLELAEKIDGDGPCCLEIQRETLIVKGTGLEDWGGKLQIVKVTGGWHVRHARGAEGYREARYATLRLHVDGRNLK